jgi:hypothetical protein
MILEKKIFEWPHPIFLIFVIMSLWREPGPLFEHFRITYTQGWFYAKFDRNWPAASEEEDFFLISVYFYSFAVISPWAGVLPFIWTILNPLLPPPPRMISAKSG